jgi:hypothetical protein
MSAIKMSTAHKEMILVSFFFILRNNDEMDISTNTGTYTIIPKLRSKNKLNILSKLT